ncbi:MAG: hypothetical protein GC162_03395 [Planctomycetes bacterium]|nr:hypothetical protein [Planctomycetota bacterium]
MSSRLSLQFPTRPAAVFLAAAMMQACMTGSLHAESSPGETAYIATPKPTFERIKADYESLARNVEAAERKVDEASLIAKRANADFDQYVRARPQEDNPVLRDAAEQTSKAEQTVRAARQKAIAPLLADPAHVQRVRELEAARQRMDEYNELRRKAVYGGVFTSDQQRAARQLAKDIAELDHVVYERELQLVEEDSAYLSARKALTASRKEVADLVKTTVNLDKADPTRRGLVESMKKANADLVAAEHALTQARQKRHDGWLKLLAAASSTP